MQDAQRKTCVSVKLLFYQSRRAIKFGDQILFFFHIRPNSQEALVAAGKNSKKS